MSVLQSELHTYAVRGLNLAYHAYGDPGGRPLLCIHGFLDHGASFRFMAEALPGFRVVAPDVRGHGHSDWVGPGGYYHFYDYYDDMRALVAGLGWERFHLLGHSMGGSVATGLAALESEKVVSLTLLEGVGPPYTDVSETVSRLGRWSAALRKPSLDAGPSARRAGRRVMSDVEDAARRLVALNPRMPLERAVSLAATATQPVEGGVVWRHDPLHRTPAAKPFLREEAVSIWRGVRAPVLSLFGADSGFRPEGLEDRHRTFANVTTGTIEGAGHNIHHDRPDVLAAVVRAWTDAPGGPVDVEGFV